MCGGCSMHSYNYDYIDKLITVDQAVGMIKTGDTIYSGWGFCGPKEFLYNLHKVAERGVKDISYVPSVLPYMPKFLKPEYREVFRIDSLYHGPPIRMAQKAGSNVTFAPTAMTHSRKRAFQRLGKINVFVTATSMPDKHGYVSMSFDCMGSPEFVEKADLVIFEMNPNFPRTFGEVQVHVSQADYVMEVNYPAPELPDEPGTEVDAKIGEFVAQHVNDGDCIQVGIGALPNMICEKLKGKKDLGIHSELMTTGLYELLKCGAANNSKKNLHKGNTVCCFVCGNREMYDYIDDNPSFQVLPGYYTNDIRVASQIDNFVAINSTLQIDFTGQCASENVGLDQISGTGGQSELTQAAQLSKGGRAFICVRSTTSVKDKETGEVKVVSNIVPALSKYAMVSCMRMDTDYVVTEYGIVNLRGATIKERTKALISIAHPDFREQLTKEALAIGYLNDLD